MNRKIASGVAALGLALSLGAAESVWAQEAQPEYDIQVVQVDKSQFPRIEVWVSVTDVEGNPVRTLPTSAFTLLENGQTVEVSDVHQAGEQGPVTAVLALDRSGSMNDVNKLEEAKAAATAFVDLMRPDDATGIVVFNTQVETVHPITSDKVALREAIARVQAFDDTAMYDALAASIYMLSGLEGRRAIIILSDGLDNRSQSAAEDILRDVEQAGTSVYTIGLGDPSVGLGSTAGIDEGALRAIAERSRGMYMYTPEPESLSELYEQLSSRLQNEYRLTYVSPNTLHDGVERGVEVRVAETASAVQTDYNPGGVIPETAQTLNWPIFAGLMIGMVALLVTPDLIRRITGASGSGGRKRNTGRVKLTGDSAGIRQGGKPKNGVPRVRLRD